MNCLAPQRTALPGAMALSEQRGMILSLSDSRTRRGVGAHFVEHLSASLLGISAERREVESDVTEDGHLFTFSLENVNWGSDATSKTRVCDVGLPEEGGLVKFVSTLPVRNSATPKVLNGPLPRAPLEMLGGSPACLCD